MLKGNVGWLPDEADVHEILVAVSGPWTTTGPPQVPIARGVLAVPVHHAIAKLLGLPTGWLNRQQEIIRRILEPVRVGSEYRVARLRFVTDGGSVDAAEWLDREFRPGGGAAGRLVYVRAEAGKGKSTTFAALIDSRLARNEGPLPLLVPLRELRRDAGVSWDVIAQTVGVVGGAATDLARAVRAGLVLLLLDGLDEASGRYDPSVIQDVVEAVREHTVPPYSLVAFSGRTTEGLLLGHDRADQLGLELPDPDSHEFREYAEGVVDALLPEWPKLVARLPEPAVGELTDKPLTPADRTALVDWIADRFADVGKDRSLFFVQSLAGLGRTCQLDGNQPLYIPGPGGAATVRPCPVSGACRLAASLACVREEGKVDPVARDRFTADRQLDAATWFAVLASADGPARAALPDPNRVTEQAFAIDSVGEAEVWLAVLRQMQKHALLYSTGGGVSAGDWQPAFLSDWVRATLLARAWVRRAEFPRAAVADVERAIAHAGRARIAFGSIFPECYDETCADLIPVLVAEAGAGSPEAAANFWHLMQGLSDGERAAVDQRPPRVAEYADFSEAEFESLDFGPEFTSNLVFFTGTRFLDCTFRGCAFTSCDMTGAVFSGCTFDRVRFAHCDGPVRFVDCRAGDGTQFDGVKSQSLPAWEFLACEFGPDVRLTQRDLPKSDTYAPLAGFAGCRLRGSRDDFLVGPELGQHRTQVTGLVAGTDAGGDPAVECLWRLLRTFFPTQFGDGGPPPARGYIRSSAIGRGAYPPGSPGPAALTALLEAEGFNDGGREGRMYAPWSGVGGVTRPELRSEFSAFVADPATRGLTVTHMLDSVRKSGNWGK